ncbi:multidrug effflux MFS transporter [Oleiagrimonas sp. C23AA]|uniref:multidrug effflux MFS transporter n=1 Tax=Oleiagrimonas sp. C23AA TaxID=2719047 RepID=UPI00142139D3|nr:multidrug effflux MFS transporter [Oleiagrimonas sp. C23AA]NII09876.1 multidrug effflux MFS transporter [Oleiagrimonas sp. C23AA]
MSRHERMQTPALWLLGLMMSIGPFGDTEYTPSMPNIAHGLHVSYGAVQATMTAYLVGSTLSRLLYGPASDRHGRRPVMLLGASILVVGALLCLLSPHIAMLAGGRFVQGVGACAGGVIADAVVRDAFAAKERPRVFARLNAIFALAPALGPIVGIYVTPVFGWQGNFALLLVLSVAMWLAVWCLLPETLAQKKPRALEPARLWRNYLAVLRHPGFAFYAVIGGFSVGIVYTALIGAPDLVMNLLGGGHTAIIIVAIAILVAFVLGAALSGWLSRHVDAMVILGGGLLVQALGAAALLLIAQMLGKAGGLYAFLVPIGVCFVGVGMIEPATTARAMEPFQEHAGTASSLLGSLQLAVAGLATAAMSLLHAGSLLDTPAVFLGLVIGGGALYVGFFMRYRSITRIRQLAHASVNPAAA